MPESHLAAPGSALATDPARLAQLFGSDDDLLPLWIAEPYVPLAPAITAAIEERSSIGWYGYETRPESLAEAFWAWMGTRHGWDGLGLSTSVSPSVGTSIGALIHLFAPEGGGVIIQPPVFTDFKPLIVAARRRPVRAPLQLTEHGYRMDLESLEEAAAEPATRVMILCNPHNPVGRSWSHDELRAAAEICARHHVFVIADEIHADLTLPPHHFTPFAVAAGGTGVRWAATHGPIKTFGLAGMCDTLLVSGDDETTERYRKLSSRFHLTRNNVVAMAAFEAAYRNAHEWVDGLLGLVATNLDVLRTGLPRPISLVEPEATYLAWIDLRGLGLEVPELASWLAAEARLALSPGHWFGREGAGFARMTIAVPTDVIEEASARLSAAAGRR